MGKRLNQIRYGMYAYQLGDVRVSFRGCMIIVDQSYIFNLIFAMQMQITQIHAIF
jgi:hypothetical protein